MSYLKRHPIHLVVVVYCLSLGECYEMACSADLESLNSTQQEGE